MGFRVAVIVEKDQHGYYAFAPELTGCQTQGETLDEVMANIREAVDLYIQCLSEEEKSAVLSKEILTTSVEVDVA